MNHSTSTILFSNYSLQHLPYRRRGIGLEDLVEVSGDAVVGHAAIAEAAHGTIHRIDLLLLGFEVKSYIVPFFSKVSHRNDTKVMLAPTASFACRSSKPLYVALFP